MNNTECQCTLCGKIMHKSDRAIWGHLIYHVNGKKEPKISRKKAQKIRFEMQGREMPENFKY